jgi:SRSO17 transposase
MTADAEQIATAGPDAELRRIACWAAGLDALHARIAGRFRRVEVRARARRYLAGLLGRVERKNGWQLAEQGGERHPRGVQRLLDGARWDAEAVRDDLRAYVVEHLNDPGAVLVVDETGFLKKGTKSVGAQRQYSGTAGRRENCQVAVFLCYAGARGRAFLDRALYLPKGWAEAPARRAEAGVPAAVRFATKPQLAKTLLARAFAAAVPAAWVAGDTVYGGNSRFRQWLEAEGRAYVLAVPHTHRVWRPDGRSRSAKRVVEALPADAWQRLAAGEGAQGPRWYDWAAVPLPVAALGGLVPMASWLLVRRSVSDPTDLAYYRAYGPITTPLAELVRVAGSRWAIEVGFEQAKGEVGLDDYEVRSWDAWHRHITLALLAHAYLEVTRTASTLEKGAAGALASSP